MASTDQTLLFIRPSVWRYFLDHTLFVVVPMALIGVVAFPENFDALGKPVYSMALLGLLYGMGYIRFLFTAPKEIRLTENRVDVSDRTDNLKSRSIRWTEMKTFRQHGGWTSKLTFRTYQERTYHIPNIGLSSAEWKTLVDTFRATAQANEVAETA